MPDAPLPPPVPVPPPPPPPPPPPGFLPTRPPPPGPLVWLAFFFGPPVLLAGGCALLQLVSGSSREGLPLVVVLGALAGLVLGACGLGGLALATRFYTGLTARIFGGLLLGGALLVGLAAVAFAGCMCVAGSTNLYR